MSFTYRKGKSRFMLASLRKIILETYGGISPGVWLLSLTQLINRSGTMVIFFLAVYLNEQLGFSKERVGLILGCYGAGQFVGTYLGGRLTDKVGYFRVMVMSLLAGGVMFILIGFVRSYALLCAGLFVTASLGEAFRPANMAAISFYSTPEMYTRSISLNRLAVNLGFSLGPVLGGLLAGYSYQLIFWADGITCIGAAAVIYYFLRRFPSRVPEKRSETPAMRKAASPLTDRLFLFFLFLAFLYAVSFFQFFSTMPLYYREVEFFSERQIGFLMGMNGILVATIEMFLISKIEKRGNQANYIAAGAVMLIASYITLLYAGGFALLLVITVVISFSEMYAMPFMNTWVNNRSNDSNKGRYMAFYGMAWALALTVNPILSTQVISNFGYSALWILLAGFALMVAVGIKVIDARRNSR